MINNLKNKYTEMVNKYNSDTGKKEYIENSICQIDLDIQNRKALDLNLQKANNILNDVSNITRQHAKEKLELIVTSALRYAYDEEMDFIVDLSVKRGVPSVDFKIKTIVDGAECIKNPINSNGGGVTDVISTALRFAYLMAIDEKLAKIIVLDEPGKMVSEGVSEKYAEFIKDLADSFDMQTIYITHKDSLEHITSNTVRVTKVNKASRIQQL